MPEGCASRRFSRIPASVAFTVSGSASASANDARETTSPASRFERRYSKPSSLGVAALDPIRPADVDPLQHRRKLASVSVRVHPDGAADGAGDVDPELEPGQPPAGDLGRCRGQPHAAAAEDVRPVALERRQLAVELQDRARAPRHRRPGDSNRSRRPRPAWPSFAAHASSSTSSVLASKAGRTARRCRPRARSSAGQGESPARRSSSATRSSASLKMSPAPIVTRRSPSPRRGARTRAAVSRSPSHITRLPPRVVRRRSGDREAAHALERADGLLARRVDVEHAHLVGGRQRGAEVGGECLRPRVEVRLEDRDQALGLKLAERGERRARPRSDGGRSRRRRRRRNARP